MNKALIISPTGCDPFFDYSFDKSDHWRFAKDHRTYDTCLVVFNDHHPPAGTYDQIIRHKGKKWAMLPEIAKKVAWQDYDYIGYWDDDYCTTIWDVNNALSIARSLDVALFQQSLTSWTVYPVLENDPSLVYTETNFIELGVPFFRNDIFRKVIKFFEDYTPGEAEWGMDKIMCHYLQRSANVIHSSTIRHMRPESSYSKDAGFKEMEHLMREWYPKYSREKLGREYSYCDKQIALGLWSKNG